MYVLLNSEIPDRDKYPGTINYWVCAALVTTWRGLTPISAIMSLYQSLSLVATVRLFAVSNSKLRRKPRQ